MTVLLERADRDITIRLLTRILPKRKDPEHRRWAHRLINRLREMRW